MTDLTDKSRLPLIKSADRDDRDERTARLVRKYMDDFVLRPALDCGRAEPVVRAWREAASEGR